MEPKPWFFVVILKSKQDESICVETTQKISLDNNTNQKKYVWSPAELSLEDYDLKGNALILQFVLQCDLGRILATQIEFPTEYFEYKESVKERILEKGKIKLSYLANKSFDKRTKNTYGTIHIKSVILNNFDIKPIIDDQSTGHKITCMVNDIYLGRAQQCKTYGKNNRTYVWSQGSTMDAFDGMSPRGNNDRDVLQEHASDLALIRMADPSGTKRRQSILQNKTPYIADNDSYSNDQNRLPLHIYPTERANVLRIYNFKFTPPKCIECKLPWKEFVPSGALSERNTSGTMTGPLALFRRKTKANVTARMGLLECLPFDDRSLIVEIMFSKLSEDKVRIVRISIKTENYEKTLNMERIQKLVSL